MFIAESLSVFHSGFFAALYIVTALAIYVYHNDIKSTIPLAWVSLGSAFAHILSYLVALTASDSAYLHIGLSSYYAWASPTVMLCIKEATSPGWLTLRRYAKYMSGFVVCTVLCFLTANKYILCTANVLSIATTIVAFSVLSKAIAQRERLVKEYFTDLDSFGQGWVKGFMYFQVAASFCMLAFLFWSNIYFGIVWNYLMAGFWLYFLIESKRRHYFSLQVPKEFALSDHTNDLPAPDSACEAESDIEASSDSEDTSQEKSTLLPSTLGYIEKQLAELGDSIYYDNHSLTLNSLAQKVGTNRTYMSGYFRAHNTTFWDFVNTKRCNHAIELMKQDKGISMNELSSLCGFRTTTCFRTTFNTICGTNPSTYKKTMIK